MTRGRRAATYAAAALVLAALLAASVLLGAKPTPPGDVVSALLAGPGGDGGAAAPATGGIPTHHIVWDLRVPRTLLAAAVGASLAVAGAVAQSWTGNRLADPGIIGVNAGAAFAVAVGLVAGVGATQTSRAMLGLVGAAAAAAVVVLISRRTRDPLTFILVGVGLTFALQAATNMMSLHTSSALQGMRMWTVGSTIGRDMPEAALAGIGLLVGLALAAAAARPLDLLEMGEDSARSLGVSPRSARALAAAVVVALAGTATAAAGLVAFVGLAAPHIVRPFTGPALTRLLPAAACAGAAACVAADIVGRFVARPGEVEMSIVLAIAGAPVMIWAVRRGRRTA
ncbi:FecCD family ABC transporter permease [Corynebacterium sp. 335C]